MPIEPRVRTALRGNDPHPDAYQEYDQKHEYSYDPGLIYLPVASSAVQRPARIRLHGGVGKRTVNWRATRLNAPPVIPAIRKDFDADIDSAEDLTEEDIENGIGVRPTDRVISNHTTVYMPLPNPQNGGYTYRAEGEMVMYQVHEDGPRVAGLDAMPTGRRPFYIAVVDDVSAEALTGYTANPAVRSSQSLSDFLDEKPEYADRTQGWPVTVYSDFFFSDNLIQE